VVQRIPSADFRLTNLVAMAYVYFDLVQTKALIWPEDGYFELDGQSLYYPNQKDTNVTITSKRKFLNTTLLSVSLSMLFWINSLMTELGSHS
jgi:hypothetical protein